MKNKKQLASCLIILLVITAVLLMYYNRTDKTAGLNIKKIKAQVTLNAEYYHRQTFYLHTQKAIPPPVYLALADISCDGIPEVFIGGVDIIKGNIFYSSYDFNMNEIEIGVHQSTDVPTKKFFIQNLSFPFLMGQRYFDKSGNPYYIAKAQYGGIPPDIELTLFQWSNMQWSTQIDDYDHKTDFDYQGDRYDIMPTYQIASRLQ